MCRTLNTIFQKFNYIRKLPLFWKTAVLVPVYKKDNPRLVEKYRPISLLWIESKIFEKSMYVPLYNHFKENPSKNQHGFVKKRSVMSILLHFLNEIYVTMDNDPTAQVIAFYSDFSKEVDTVPHKLLISELCDIGVGGCSLDIPYDYINQQKQYVRIEDHTSKELQVISGLTQSSLLSCIFINDLPDFLIFTQLFIFPDDLRILAISISNEEVKTNIKRIGKWLKSNKMQLAVNKCHLLNFRGRRTCLSLNGQPLWEPGNWKAWESTLRTR